MDLYIFNFINQFAGKWICLDIMAIFFAAYFEYILIAVLIFLLIFKFKKWAKIFFLSFLSAFISRLVIALLIHHFFPVDRPFVSENVNLILNHSPTPAFPSGHASFYFALATVILLKNLKIGALFFISAFFISFFRVFCGIHWFSDILCGMSIGILVGCLIYKMLLEKDIKKTD